MDRSLVVTGASLFAPVASCPGVYRWVGSVPRKHPAGVPRKSQTDSRTRTSLSAGVVRAVYRDGHQAHGKETSRRSNPENDAGTLEQASILLQASLGGSVLNTAFIERFNGTMRERLASLTRTCRHAAQRLEGLESG